MTALILSARLMTFAHWFSIEGIDEKFLVDDQTMIRAHIDYELRHCLIEFFIKKALICLLLHAGASQLEASLTQVMLSLQPLTLIFGTKQYKSFCLQ